MAKTPEALLYANAAACPSNGCAVSWQAIIAGAFAAIAVSMMLLILGSGLGFAMVSPWDIQNTSLTTVTITTIVWLIVMQWASAGIGGYISGRLRTRWLNTRDDEVFFRDTAHGFLTWCVATVLTATVLATSLTAITGGVVTGEPASAAVSANVYVDETASDIVVTAGEGEGRESVTVNKEEARKATATLSLFTALSMFIGAFIACVSAALGGRCRDTD